MCLFAGSVVHYHLNLTVAGRPDLDSLHSGFFFFFNIVTVTTFIFCISLPSVPPFSVYSLCKYLEFFLSVSQYLGVTLSVHFWQ